MALTRPLGARDLLATLYHVLAIDPKLQSVNGSGRPLPALVAAQLRRWQRRARRATLDG